MEIPRIVLRLIGLFPINMANQINLGQLRRGQAIVNEDNPFLVLEAAHHKMGRGGAVVKTKLKNLQNGSVVDKTFQGNDTLNLADINYSNCQFLYSDENGVHLMDDKYEQFQLNKGLVGDDIKYLKEGGRVDVAFWDNSPIFIKLPAKVELEVSEAPPAVKGDTATSPSKIITLITGYELSAPMFIKKGDVVRVNTETGEYVERV